MASQERRQRGRPREFDRQQALCAALAVFWKHGYSETTMRMLSKAMGIGSPSIYCAFGNKAELFIEALKYYRQTYWQPLFDQLLAEKDIYGATLEFFDSSARALLCATAPCGCLTVRAAMCVPENEPEIAATLEAMRLDTAVMFRKRIIISIESGQLPQDCNVPAIAGALTNFFEGLALQASERYCQAELIQIARQGVRLLPDPASCKHTSPAF